MGDIRHLRTKLVGVTFPNADGSSRQALIARCRAGERLTLRHEPDNPVDDHAVAVYNAAGEQLGHLRSTVEYERPDAKRLKWPLTEYRKARPARQCRRPAWAGPDRGSDVRIWRVIIMAVILVAAVLVSLVLVSGALP